MLRKKRNDRNYVLYELIGPNQENYIGLTVAVGRSYDKSVKVRVQKHISRAIREDKAWTLCNFLRTAEFIEYRVLEVVRGRKSAYQRERELINTYSPSLNTF
jgi:hypothetical protein